MPKLLIINAHQTVDGISAGKLNKTLVDTIANEMTSRGYAVKHTRIESGYDINEEVDKHVWADIIILQSPVFWFGSPWLHKKYVEEVLTAGLLEQRLLTGDGRSRYDPSKQYGTGGSMQGKKYMLSLTWNAPQEAFGDQSQFLFNGKTVDDIFVGNTVCYKFCGAEVVASFSCFNVMKVTDLESDIKRLKAHLDLVF